MYTDPFEPQPGGLGTIYPFFVNENSTQKGYVELLHTLPQDHCLFVIMGEKNIDIWKKKLDWTAEHVGAVLLITHPDYMNFDGKKARMEAYPIEYYKEYLEYLVFKYNGQIWHVLLKEMANFCKELQRNRA